MPSIAKDRLRRLIKSNKLTNEIKSIAELRLEYSELSHLLTHYVNKLQDQDRIYPHILPTQKSRRWSTYDPPLTNFPKKCINPSCAAGWHEKSPECWSLRDCILPDAGTYWVDGDLDAIEARIFALKVGDYEAIEAFNNNLDIHTPTACDLFHLAYPQDLANPHSSEIDRSWRTEVKWRGKDDLRRGIAKNFRYGTQYCLKPEAVLGIKDLEQFNLSQREILRLAYIFWELTAKQQAAKFEHIKRIRKDKIARTLYGFRRIFFDASDDTAKEGFNHEVQGTVVDYMNQVLISINKEYPESYLVHNAHDGYKIAFPYSNNVDQQHIMSSVKLLTEGSFTDSNMTVQVTATCKIISAKE